MRLIVVNLAPSIECIEVDLINFRLLTTVINQLICYQKKEMDELETKLVFHGIKVEAK